MSVKHLIAPSVMTLALAGLVGCGTKSKKDSQSEPTAKKPSVQVNCEAEVKKKAEQGDKYTLTDADLIAFAGAVGVKDLDAKTLSNEKCAEIAKKASEAKYFSLANAAAYKNWENLSALNPANLVKLDLAGAKGLIDVTHGDNKTKRDNDDASLKTGDVVGGNQDGTTYLAALQAVADKEAKGEEATEEEKAALETAAKNIEARFTATKIKREEFEALVKLVAKIEKEHAGNTEIDKVLTTEALKLVSKFTKLTDLDLDNTEVKILAGLKDLKDLVNVGLVATNVSEDDLKSFATARDKEEGPLKVVYTKNAKPESIKHVKYEPKEFGLKGKIKEELEKKENK